VTSEFKIEDFKLVHKGQVRNFADDPLLWLAWFPTAMPQGPALGDPEQITWGNLCDVFSGVRRHGPKDGPGFCAARFRLEEGGRQVRRIKSNLLARTAIAMDIEASKGTGELPPTLDEMAKRIEARGWAAALWTSHNHNPPNDIRYRIVLPLSEEIDHELPAPDVIAAVLGVAGVLDKSKLGAASYFYLPSCSGDDTADVHQEIIVPGALIDAQWLRERATALQEAREAERERQAAEAHAKAQERLQARLAAGFDPADSLIEKLRQRLDLEATLRAHGYDVSGGMYRHPNSQSGSYGADIKTFGGIQRVYSHNAGDPLHRDNLPAWCDGVTALDVVDVVSILEFGGDRSRALRELAERFGLSKREEKRGVAALIFQLRERREPQEVIEAAALTKGRLLGLSPEEVCQVARWVVAQPTVREAA
jgi:hypothetical protein